MEGSHIAELLKPFLWHDLSHEQLYHISMYIDILLKWNRRMNLTAVRRPEQIVTRHFGESLFAAQHLFSSVHPESTKRSPRTAASQRDPSDGRARAETDVASHLSTVVDVGSGAGFPGLPLRIWTSEVQLTLIESNHKKATFLREVVRALGLEGVEVFVGRAEGFPAASADIVTLRAVERFENILPIAAGLVSTGGRLALLIGNQQIERAKAIVTDLKWQAAVPVPLSNNRAVLVGEGGRHQTGLQNYLRS
jgi:16S rRNA (guanine527-N7)-methyltransferase